MASDVGVADAGKPVAGGRHPPPPRTARLDAQRSGPALRGFPADAGRGGGRSEKSLVECHGAHRGGVWPAALPVAFGGVALAATAAGGLS